MGERCKSGPSLLFRWLSRLTVMEKMLIMQVKLLKKSVVSSAKVKSGFSLINIICIGMSRAGFAFTGISPPSVLVRASVELKNICNYATMEFFQGICLLSPS